VAFFFVAFRFVAFFRAAILGYPPLLNRLVSDGP